MNMVLHL